MGIMITIAGSLKGILGDLNYEHDIRRNTQRVHHLLWLRKHVCGSIGVHKDLGAELHPLGCWQEGVTEWEFSIWPWGLNLESELFLPHHSSENASSDGKRLTIHFLLPVLRHLLHPQGFKALLVNLLGLAHSHRSSLACWRVCLLPQFPSRPSWWISLSYRISQGPKTCLQWTCKSWSRNSRHLSLGHQTLFCPNMRCLA